VPTDSDREQDAWVVTAGAEPPEDWLAITVRSALRSSVGNARPLPAIWNRIQQSIATMSLSHKGEDSTMLSYNDFLVRREHYKNLLWEAEQERLIRAAGLRQPGNRRLHRTVVGWIGTRMVRWGHKLQHYGTTPPPLCCPQAASDY
jgi:hypothetical protein